MKLPLRVTSQPRHGLARKVIPVADADHNIVCNVVVRPGAQEFAEELVKRFNWPSKWWHRLRNVTIGSARDARQRAYDSWVWTRGA